MASALLRFLLLALWVVLSGCARSAPHRSSPEFVVLPGTPVPLAVDRLNDELVWLDEARQTVLVRRGGQDVALQPVTIPEEELSGVLRVRAFPDGSFLLERDGTIVRYKMGEAPHSIASSWPRSLGFDGRSIDDFWFWATGVLAPLPGISEDNSGLCHVLGGIVVECVPTPDDLEGELALGADGALYLARFSGSLLHYLDGGFTEVARSAEYAFYEFFRQGETLLFTTQEDRVYEVWGKSLILLPTEGYVTHVVGSGDDFFYVTSDHESVKRDPDCTGGFAGSCSRITAWREHVVWHFDHGKTTEVGHDLCLHTDPPGCGPEIEALGFDQGELVVFGAVVRGLGE